MKLWQKNNCATAEVDRFTVGRDREMDMYLAEADVLGSLAHTRMLETIGLLTAAELADVQRELKAIYKEMEAGEFRIEDDMEDIHSQVELIPGKSGTPARRYTAGVRGTIRCWSTCGSTCGARSTGSSWVPNACSIRFRDWPNGTKGC